MSYIPLNLTEMFIMTPIAPSSPSLGGSVDKASDKKPTTQVRILVGMIFLDIFFFMKQLLS